MSDIASDTPANLLDCICMDSGTLEWNNRDEGRGYANWARLTLHINCPGKACQAYLLSIKAEVFALAILKRQQIVIVIKN